MQEWDVSNETNKQTIIIIINFNNNDNKIINRRKKSTLKSRFIYYSVSFQHFICKKKKNGKERDWMTKLASRWSKVKKKVLNKQRPNPMM